MRQRTVALLLSLFAARPATAVMLDIRPLAETQAAPLAVSAAASAPLIPAPPLAAPSLSAATPLFAPAAAFAAPAALAAAPAESATAPVAFVAAPAAAAAVPALVGPARAAASLPQLAQAASALAAADDSGKRRGILSRLFTGGRDASRDDPAAVNAVSAAPAPEAPKSGSLAADPTDAELEALFAAARPGSRAIKVLKDQGGFAAAAAGIIHEYTFRVEDMLEEMRASPRRRDAKAAAAIQAVSDLVEVARARQDPAARRFLEAVGRRAAHQHLLQEKSAARAQELSVLSRNGQERRHLPRNALGSGDYWDMAAGPNAGMFILKGELEPGTHYSFFDISPYVISYLDTLAAAKGADVSAVEADILKLQRPARPLAVLRTKNAVVYVPGFEKKLEEMADWVAPGGRLVIQNDPQRGQRRASIEKHGPLALRLLEEGWDLEFEFARAPGATHVLDTLIFTRPLKSGSTRAKDQAREIWERYLAAEREIGSDMMEMLGLIFGYR